MDKLARQQALDTTTSFIVQAPAGSGKTELLTQRFLALLAQVSEPEQILALTFTKKAALEMSQRILQALRDAANKQIVKNEHQYTTRQLATAALEHANNLNWNLLNNPQRLRVKTFDSFCLEIYKAIPKEEFATLANLQTDPDDICQKAVQQWFDFCRGNELYHTDLKCLISQVNNQVSTLFKQLKNLLKKRDQWLTIIQDNKHRDLNAHLATVRVLAYKHWGNWYASLPAEMVTAIINLLHNYHDYVPDKFTALTGLHSFDELTSQKLSALKNLLLTGQGNIRKSFDHHVGVLKSNDVRYTDLKEQSTKVLQALHDYPEFITQLTSLANIPHPDEIELDWEIIQAYYRLLPLLVAHLHVEFESQESMDYIYVAQLAIYALQNNDVSLYFDNLLQHLLIDEYQDTSLIQLELINQLIKEWSSSDNKSLFIVGDPMQSIYRFRSAEVGIFLRTMQNGLGNMQLTPLHLVKNFRSDFNLIEHFNEQFIHIFPKHTNLELGGVSFLAAQPVVEHTEECFVRALYYENAAQQAQAIINILAEAQLQENLNVAILVRTRSKLPAILNQLAVHNFSYSGVDLFPLGERLYIRDLWNLTKLFIEPGNRVYELAVLRSPLCGLTLEELEKIARLDPKTSILEFLVANPFNCARLNYFLEVYANAWQQRLQSPLCSQILNIANELSFFKTLSAHELDEVMLFFKLFEQISEKHDLPSIANIQEKLDNTYVSSAGELKLQVMTIHKSKGLEFDWVILPDMGSKSQTSEKHIFKWLTTSSERVILPNTNHSIQLIEWYEKQQEQHELQRLCYVAFTRAKKRLYCLDSQTQASNGSLRNLFAKDYFQAGETSALSNHVEQVPQQKRIKQEDYIQKIHTEYLYHLGETFNNATRSKTIGIVTHLMLQWVCQYCPEDYATIPWSLAAQKLRYYGFYDQKNTSMLEEVQQLVLNFLKHPVGQWIAQPREFAKNEFSLLITDGEITRNIIIDRVFIDNERIWIVDFKSKQDSDKYRNQLNRYASAIGQLYPNYPITCGLFFLATGAWVTWDQVELVT